MANTLTIPGDKMPLVVNALRSAANDFHGAMARHPKEDSFMEMWRNYASFLDELADKLAEHQNGPIKFK